jgi:hypothetical protein
MQQEQAITDTDLTNRFTRLDHHAQRIRDLVNDARKAIIEIGNELIAAKSEMEHGEWLPWLQSNFGWSESSAQNYMNVARAFGKSPTVGDLTGIAIEGRALYYLASKNVPNEVREEAVALAKTKPVKLSDAKNLHHKSKPKSKPHSDLVMSGEQALRMAEARDAHVYLDDDGELRWELDDVLDDGSREELEDVLFVNADKVKDVLIARAQDEVAKPFVRVEDMTSEPEPTESQPVPPVPQSAAPPTLEDRLDSFLEYIAAFYHDWEYGKLTFRERTPEALTVLQTSVEEINGALADLKDIFAQSQPDPKRQPSEYTVAFKVTATNIRSLNKQIATAFPTCMELEVDRPSAGSSSRAARLSAAEADFESAKDAVTELKSEIENWKDNLPDNFKGGSKEDELQECADALEQLESSLEGVDDWDGVQFPSMMG